MTDWSSLPEELLRLVLGRLSSPRDNARSSAVCKLWHSICKVKTFAWLMLADFEPQNHTYGFFSLSDRQVYNIHLPESEDWLVCGASHGWLVTIDIDYVLRLLDPFSRTQIQLPPLDKKYSIYINMFPGIDGVVKYLRHLYKFVMSSDPRTNPSECIIMMVESGQLSYCRVGDEKWTPFPSFSDRPYDLTFYKEHFCVLEGAFYEGHFTEQLFICDIDPKPHFTAFGPKKLFSTDVYLVDSEGDLLLAARYPNEYLYGYEYEKEDAVVDCPEGFEEPLAPVFSVPEDEYWTSWGEHWGGDEIKESDNEDAAIDDLTGLEEGPSHVFEDLDCEYMIHEYGDEMEESDKDDAVVDDQKDFVNGPFHAMENDEDDATDGLKGFGKEPFHVYKDVSAGGVCYDRNEVTGSFHVYKLDARGTTWTRLNDIGDRALFVGCKNSLSLSARSISGCVENSVYYTDMYMYGNHRVSFNETGMFSLKDSRVHSQYLNFDDVRDFTDYLPSIWLVQGSRQRPESSQSDLNHKYSASNPS